EPAATSARPPTRIIRVFCTAPKSPAARANGTVSPSDMPITTSRTKLPAVKCFSTCGARGIKQPPDEISNTPASAEPHAAHRDKPAYSPLHLVGPTWRAYPQYALRMLFHQCARPHTADDKTQQPQLPAARHTR